MSPYSGVNDKTLPSYVKNKSPKIRAKWIAIFNAAFKTDGEKVAITVANKWLKRTVKKKEIQAKSLNLRKISLTPVMEDGEFIKKSANGDEYVSFTLTDVLKDEQGDSYPDALLKRWADEINSGNYIVGDVDHKEYDMITATTPDAGVIAKRLKEKKGIAKAVQAIYEKGRLWIKALIDKRYKRLVKKKGVSLEAYVERNDDGDIVDGDLYGFSFMLSEPQANPRAVVS